MASITYDGFVKRVASHAATMTNGAQCSAIVQSVLDVIAFELLHTGEINLKGIGRLKRVVRPAHTGKNPRTGAAVAVPQKMAVRFKASKMLVL